MKGLDLYIAKRISNLQSKYNFNPSKGAKQVKGVPELDMPFGCFSELLAINTKFNLGISIPYDPIGLNPASNLVQIKTPKTEVYFLQVDGSTTWKIGYSKEPYERCRALQVGHDQRVSIRYVHAGGRKLERAIHNHLKSYKYDRKSDMLKALRGEWFNIPDEYLESFLRRLKTEGEGFLYSSP